MYEDSIPRTVYTGMLLWYESKYVLWQLIATSGACDKSYLISQINEQLQINLSSLSKLITVEHHLDAEKLEIKKNKKKFTFGYQDRLYVFVHGKTIRMYIDKKSMFKNRQLDDSVFSLDLTEQLECYRYSILSKISNPKQKKRPKSFS